MLSITSHKNPLIKEIVLLQEKSRHRNKSRKFIIEGLRELNIAMSANYTLEKLLFCPDIIEASSIEGINIEVETVTISKSVYDKVAYRGSTEGVMAIAKQKNHKLSSDISLPEKPLILIAEGIEKPGNLGALLRTADATQIDALILVNPKCDFYNPNCIRSSVGCAFSLPVFESTNEECLAFLKTLNINIYASSLQDSEYYLEQDYTSSCAIVVGTESTGLSYFWKENATTRIKIPMKGQIDSLNVSVATAVMLYEVKRQRGLK
ncbi:MAG: rRNA methyltransferase [Flavobacteriaceae bacterium]|nr:rRNA methyltransferase [Flavobacteriaceae bacterium]